jgi:predicted nuclease of predicted toxin-antitoxin system
VKVLVDAHLPRRIVRWFGHAGYDAVHTLDLPKGNRTPDWEINEISEREQRVVVTKDSDFVNSFIVSGKPYKLLLVSTGNISNAKLEALLVPLIPSIAIEFQTHSFLELLPTGFIVRT